MAFVHERDIELQMPASPLQDGPGGGTEVAWLQEVGYIKEAPRTQIVWGQNREVLAATAPPIPVPFTKEEIRRLQTAYLKKEGGVPAALDERKWKLAVDLYSRLGYRKMAEQLAPAKLTETLYLLDIAPLSERSVLVYQEKMGEEMDKKVKEARNGKPGPPIHHAWTVSELSYHRNAVPQNILETALKVCNELPLAHFFIEELVDIDPFLVVDFYGAKKYIGVWNEPTFDIIEAQLESE